MTASSSQPARAVQPFSPDPPPSSNTTVRLVPALAASPSRLALAARQLGFAAPHRGGESNRDYFAGPPDGPYSSLQRCPGGQNSTIRRVDASGDFVVFTNCDRRAEVRDPSSPLPGSMFGTEVQAPRLAGRYLAVFEPTVAGGGIAVYDHVAGTEVYRVPSAEMPGYARSLAVQDDGKIAVSYGVTANSRKTVVGWASPADPHIHRLPLPARIGYDVHIAGDRIAFQRGVRVRAPYVLSEVGVSDLDGRARILARRTDDETSRESFDFDGQRVALVRVTCRDAEIVATPVDVDRQVRGSARSCPLRLTRRPSVGRSRVVLTIRCPWFARPTCEAGVAVLRAVRSKMLIGTGDSSSNRVPVRLTRVGRRALAGGATVRVRASVTARDGNTERSQRLVGTFSIRRG